MSKTDKSATVFVIDDDQSVRASIANLVRSVGMDAELFASTDEFLALRQWRRPGCLVLDVRLPGRSGLDFQGDLARANISMPIVFISGHADVPMSVRAMKAGAVEFIVKPVHPQDLLDAIQTATAQDAARCRDANVEKELRQRFSTLTPREREVLTMVTSGLMNKQIAAALEISEATVKMHRASVMRKMNAASVPDLVRMADKLLARLQHDT